MQIIQWDGKPITRPGIYDGVPIEVYHRGHDELFAGQPNISSTGLRIIASPEGSLEQFYETYPGNPDRAPPKEDDHFAFGHACHMLFLGEPGFRERFVIHPETYPEQDKKGEPTGAMKPWHGGATFCKNWLAEAKAQKKSVLSPKEFEDIKKMAAKLGTNQTIQDGILNGLVEKSIFWFRDVVLDDGRVIRVWLKARPDVIPTDSNMIVDYKTTADASPKACRDSITNFGYHQQLALAHEGLWVTTGRAMEEHLLVFQAKSRPYAVNVKPLMGSAIHAGHMLNWQALRKFAKAIADDEWPGYEDDMVPCDLNDWRLKQIKLEVDAGYLVDPPELEPIRPDLLALPAPAPELADEVI